MDSRTTITKKAIIGVAIMLMALFTSQWSGCACEPSVPQAENTQDAGPVEVSSESLPEVSPEGQTEPAPELSTEPSPTPDAPPEKAPDAVVTSGRPNIVLIIADDYGTDVSLVYHDEDGDGKADDNRAYANTPTINGICRTGVRFRQAWSTSLCSSTRASILTGRHGFRTGIGEAVAKNEGLRTTEYTIPKVLDLHTALGFQHANIGKWHLGTTTELQGDKAPNTMGWSHYAGSLSGELTDFSDWTKVTNGQSAAVKEYATTVNVDDAIGWLGQRDRTKPWLLWLAFNAPHNPLHLPPAGLHTNKALSGTAADIRTNGPAYYRAAMEAMDTELLRLFTWLKANGQYDNTLFVFLGDNGTQQMAVEAPYDRQRSKGTLYQNGIHVPVCVSGALVKQGGRTSDALIHTVDFFATLLAAAGVDVAKDLPQGVTVDSVSFLPLLQDPNATFSRDWNYTERFASGEEGKGTQTIRDQTFKLLRQYDNAGTPTDALFDLKADPMEATDLLSGGIAALNATQKDAYEKLASQLTTLHKAP